MSDGFDVYRPVLNHFLRNLANLLRACRSKFDLRHELKGSLFQRQIGGEERVRDLHEHGLHHVETGGEDAEVVRPPCLR